jgi:hypothetical protein
VVRNVVDVLDANLVVATFREALAGSVAGVAGSAFVVRSDGAMVEASGSPVDPVARTPGEAPCPQAVSAIATIVATRPDRDDLTLPRWLRPDRPTRQAIPETGETLIGDPPSAIGTLCQAEAARGAGSRCGPGCGLTAEPALGVGSVTLVIGVVPTCPPGATRALPTARDRHVQVALQPALLVVGSGERMHVATVIAAPSPFDPSRTLGRRRGEYPLAGWDFAAALVRGWGTGDVAKGAKS